MLEKLQQELVTKATKAYGDEVKEKIKKAYQFALRVHDGQKRSSGDPFCIHPMEVAIILIDLGMDADTTAAGLLHDTIEDTDVTKDELSDMFGPEVAMLVDGVTKLGRLSYKTKEEQQVENLRKMFLAMAEDIRVIIIKLADRLHNLRTLEYIDEDKQREKAYETLEIYAPLAHRLGIYKIKWELEDIALRYIDPKGYYDLVDKVAKKRKEREAYIQEIIETLGEKLPEANLEFEIEGRPKNFYSIYKKMYMQHKEFEQIYDLLAVRILVNNIKDCYGVLGIIHALWKPIPGRFKDYIAVPKSNLYQSLHTTVMVPHGEPYEIQIRTWDMHRTAEKGVAAHWMYKEGRSKDMSDEAKVGWLREAIEWLQEVKDPQEFMDTLKIDLFEDEVFVFTPKGDVKTLPNGATPVDFAFEIHTDVGLSCFGAKVNGRIVPLNYELKNGDYVEILTSKSANPTRDWLAFVKTSKARSRIRSWLKEEQREENVNRGRELLERETKKASLEVREVLSEANLKKVAQKYGVSTPEELLASVGSGRIKAPQVLQKIIGQDTTEQRRLPEVDEKKWREATRGIEVEGADNLLVRFSKCCNPVPGDPILGYVTRGRGISVHRADCPNVQNLDLDSGREIEVKWNAAESDSYPVEIEIEAIDKPNLLTSIMNTLSERKANVEAVTARSRKFESAMIQLVVEIHDVDHLNNVMGALRQVSGVLNVYRASPT